MGTTQGEKRQEKPTSIRRTNTISDSNPLIVILLTLRCG